MHATARDALQYPPLDEKAARHLVSQLTVVNKDGSGEVPRDGLQGLKRQLLHTPNSAGLVCSELLRRLQAKHARARLLALTVWNELFLRSKAYRDTAVPRLRTLTELAIAPGSGDVFAISPTGRPRLPPPKDVACTLRHFAVECFRQWRDRFGAFYPALAVAYEVVRPYGATLSQPIEQQLPLPQPTSEWECVFSASDENPVNVPEDVSVVISVLPGNNEAPEADIPPSKRQKRQADHAKRIEAAAASAAATAAVSAEPHLSGPRRAIVERFSALLSTCASGTELATELECHTFAISGGCANDAYRRRARSLLRKLAEEPVLEALTSKQLSPRRLV
eukprot:TRINITY_DN18695_c0_g1_i1.p1 TRINITY_DN18695_c0_g1~~TRINITY_DN18695_c0_g1_i1.p1  ORF type:complete len:343 (+),score=56.11 TRINITY_DN18695_c0_g1_i1:22-1029(+)